MAKAGWVIERETSTKSGRIWIKCSYLLHTSNDEGIRKWPPIPRTLSHKFWNFKLGKGFKVGSTFEFWGSAFDFHTIDLTLHCSQISTLPPSIEAAFYKIIFNFFLFPTFIFISLPYFNFINNKGLFFFFSIPHPKITTNHKKPRLQECSIAL